MTVLCQKFVQSILELRATDEIHMEDRKKVWPELHVSPKRVLLVARVKFESRVGFQIFFFFVFFFFSITLMM